MSFEIGTTAGGYEFIDVLDSSRAGVAYKVRNIVAQRLEMLRILPRGAQEDQERVERFLREIKVHARLVHPNIVVFYNATEIDKQLVMTTELVEGITLAERLKLGALASDPAIALMSQVLSALSCAHGQGVVHRDLTPSNILITPEGEAKLTGFGLAKGAADPHLTQAGVVQGSLHYISPEQVKGVAQLDERSDIYSAGVVLYEMITGHPPFDAKSQFEVMAAHVTTQPRAPSAVNPAAPKELDAVILRALEKDPAQRYQSAEEFREALHNIHSRAAQAKASVPDVPLFASAPSSGWSARELMLVGVFLIIGVLAFALLAIHRT